MNDPCRIELFGGLRVPRSSPPTLKFRTRRVASLLARLAYTGRMESRESLIEWLWPDCDLETGRNRFSVTLSSLRRALEMGAPGAIVQATHSAVGLVLGAIVTDVGEFEVALQRAEAKDNKDNRLDVEAEAQYLLRAIELYGGELLPDYHDDWILPERGRLADRFFHAVCRLEELGSAPPAEIVSHLQRALAFDPTREDVTRALMRSYGKGGQVSRAVRCYQDLEAALQADNGTHPAPATRQLKARLTADSENPAPPPVEPLALPETATHLPLPRNGFFGRAKELHRLVAWAFAEPLAGTSPPDTAGRLVTLTGGGGSGKTRLALEVARVGVNWVGTICFVPLMDIAQPEGVLDAILRALGVMLPSGGDPLSLVTEALNRRPVLLILDNFEHLVEAGATVLLRLVESTTQTRYLVTSQRRLGLSQETEIVVPLLSAPLLAAEDREEAAAIEVERARTNEAVQLFVERSQVVRPNFALRVENVRSVVQLCRVLEGVPLALELAASRARALSPEQMLTPLGTRLNFLQQRREETGADPRHRSLRAALDWSYDLLPPSVQRCFRQLAVFQGGWALEAAEAICFEMSLTPSPSLLESELSAHEIHELLCEHSLLETGELGGTLRFRFLEAVREYALERAIQEEVPADWLTLQRRHAAYFVQLAESAAQPLRSTQTATWIVRLASEQPNLRAALSWALEDEPLTSLRLSAALWWFWFLHDAITEGRVWLTRALQTFEADSFALDTSSKSAFSEAERDALLWRAEALCGAGFLAWRQGDFAQAGTLSAQSLEINRAAHHPRSIAYSIIVLLMTRVLSNDFETANNLGSECLQICRELGDQIGQGFALHLLAVTAEHAAELPRALSLHEQSVALFRALGAKDGMAYTLLNLGNARRRNHNFPQALRALDESLALFRNLSNREGEAYALLYRAMVLALTGERAIALDTYRTTLNTFQGLNLQWGLAQCLESLAFSLEDNSDDPTRPNTSRNTHSDIETLLRAVRLWSAAHAIRETIGAFVPPVDEPRYAHFIAKLHQRLEAPSFDAAWQTGRVLTREQILRDAVAA